MKIFSYGRQSIDEDDIEAVTRVMRSDFLTQGPVVEQFERAIADYCGASYALAVSSGTAGLHLSYMALGIGAPDAIITCTNTFVATSNSAIFTGARPFFTDIDPASFNMSAPLLSHAIAQVKSAELKTKAIVPVHFAGLPVDMPAIKKLADRAGSAVIEDACHALGASWRDSNGLTHKVGDCSYSDTSVFSFHPVKPITMGEGGVVTTNDPDLYKSMKALRSHGVTKDKGSFIHDDIACLKGEYNPWYYEMQALGTNYRITDIQCALGLSQLKKLNAFIRRRNEIATIYGSLFAQIPFINPQSITDGFKSAYHLYVVEVDWANLSITKGEWFQDMADKGIRLQSHYIPVHLQAYYRSMFGYKVNDLPVAESYYKKTVSLPIYPALSDADVDFIGRAVIDTLSVRA